MQKIDKMNKELLIRSSSNNVDFALLKDGKLIEFHKDNDNTKFLVGDIYLAKIRKTMPALNAVFVNSIISLCTSILSIAFAEIIAFL